MKHIKTNEVGKRYGRLLVIASTTSSDNRARWVCQCDCGKTCIATGKTLREGKKQSCGCLHKEKVQQLVKVLHKNNELGYGEAACNHLYSVYKWNAGKRKLEFSLSIGEFKKLTSDVCYYCGAKPAFAHNGVTCSTPYVYNGIDRVDNKLGYTSENSVTCCRTCNWMKRTMTIDDFVAKCAEIVINMNYKKPAEMTGSV